ncbi:ferric-dicitrate binding protein FerR, regulates iron transport through sigma-19 [Catalinimonas alkaloidigena]|uniref:Ferric-dicitrate binding protein FerR, regulates iron transport through sigma-19 n=1 Tax=Catalinimonas alkaloidigena TaxID=1075417 RepID=A0A1G9BXD2_9BACT|nr:FecR domain-containing protein [Catalinimonas alkaloidigena]SDK43844.1 ferric-dicitrate binding protein FerR, regulates iron transport through sigma-19 [Catalinimonas alkaloidigena]
MEQQLSQTILHTYFAGQATPLQKQMILEWLQHAENQELYYQWLEAWEAEHPQYMADPAPALAQFQALLDRQATPAQPTHVKAPAVRRVRFRWWWPAAAAVVIGMGVGLFGRSLGYRHYTTAYGEVREVLLEDGSRVTLNAHSSLYVPRWFGGWGRTVRLEGEAEFVVQPTDDHQRFLVETSEGTEVEVLGTTFAIASRPRGTRVVLLEGSIQLQTSAQALTLEPGDVARIGEEGTIHRQQVDSVTPYLAWKDHRFVFDETTLREVADQVNEIFGVKVEIADPTLARRTVTGTYQAENADDLLLVLAELMDIEVSQQGDDRRLSARQ